LTVPCSCATIALILKLNFRLIPNLYFSERRRFLCIPSVRYPNCSKILEVPASTLRYYDKEGLFPEIKRSGGIRYFDTTELEALRLVECLKKTGMEIKNIKQFMQWCTEGSETYPKRLELIQKQKLECEKEIKRMEKALAMLKFKCWYYETALADGNEDRIHEMLPDRLPEEIQAYYDASHTD